MGYSHIRFLTAGLITGPLAKTLTNDRTIIPLPPISPEFDRYAVRSLGGRSTPPSSGSVCFSPPSRRSSHPIHSLTRLDLT
jgi:hypothetical protein